MAIQQRNRVLRDLQTEYTSFLREQLRILQFGFSNMKQPTGKDAEDLRHQGNLLNKLFSVWSKLQQLATEKDTLLHMQTTCEYMYLPKEKVKYEKKWASDHDKQLDLGDEYISLKREYMKLYS